MSGEEDWRADTNADTYFGHQQKKTNVADRRPVIRKPADLVGPGIAAEAVRIADFNNLLATYNGYFSAEIGAFGAPNDDEPFVGITVMDASLGGFQLFTGLGTGVGLGATWRRRFIRNPSDPESILWEAWVNETESEALVGLISIWLKSTPPAKHLILDGSSFDAGVYPELATFLGGTTLPDLRDRTVYGVGSAWTLLGTDGLSLGSRTKNLYHSHNVSVSSAGDHTHGGTTSNTGNHVHTIADANMGSADNTMGTGSLHRLISGETHDHGGFTSSDGTHEHFYITSSNGAHVHGASTSDAGSSGPLLRGVGMNYIIRAAA